MNSIRAEATAVRVDPKTHAPADRAAKSGEHRVSGAVDVFSTHHALRAQLPSQARILLASSSVGQRSMLLTLLKLAGYEVQSLRNGGELAGVLNGPALFDVLIIELPLTGWDLKQARTLLGKGTFPVLLVGNDLALLRRTFIRPMDLQPGRLMEARLEPMAIEEAVVSALLLHPQRRVTADGAAQPGQMPP